MQLRIGGVTIALTCDGARLALPAGDFAPFLVPDGHHDATVHAGWATLAGGASGERVFDAGGLWTLDRQDGRLVFRFFSSRLGPEPYKQASFAPGFVTGDVRLHQPYFADGAAADPLAYPLDELLLIHLLAGCGGIEMHACGLRDRSGAGYLFVGQSGAGKSTMARLWRDQPGVTVLSDDRIVVRVGEGGLTMYGTPWHGDERLASPESVELTAVYFLRQGDRHAMAPLPRGLAAARLFACCFPPFHDALGMSATAEVLDRIVHRVPCSELRFTPTRSVVEFVRGQAI